jgi:hypothetical protein
MFGNCSGTCCKRWLQTYLGKGAGQRVCENYHFVKSCWGNVGKSLLVNWSLKHFGQRIFNLFGGALTRGHLGSARAIPSDAVARDVLACKIVGVDAMPDACCDLYDAHPSRDLWEATMLTWLEQVQIRCAGCFGHYYLKFSLDRVFAVRKLDPGTISWWPTECPAYLTWYKLLYPARNLSQQEKFQVLCKTYVTLNQHKSCTIPDALAQTCWMKKEEHGNLHVYVDR